MAHSSGPWQSKRMGEGQYRLYAPGQDRLHTIGDLNLRNNNRGDLMAIMAAPLLLDACGAVLDSGSLRVFEIVCDILNTGMLDDERFEPMKKELVHILTKGTQKLDEFHYGNLLGQVREALEAAQEK